MEQLLEVEHLQVVYHTYAGQVQSVRDITFQVRPGESVAIVGESGCGKSVTAKSVMGLIQSPPGEIRAGSRILFEGRDILSFTDKEWQAYRGACCSIIFQDALAALNPTLRIGRQIAEKLMLHRKLTKDQARQEAIELLSLVGIQDPEKRYRQYPHEFSGGMRQRVMIAIALACNPRLLIADEPTTALDVTIQADIIELIKKLQKQFSMAVILITHDLGIVADIAERILVMYAGKIVERGDSHQIFYSPRHPYTQALLQSVPRLDLEEGKELSFIEGAPPNMLTPPDGCPFAGRCPHTMRVCRLEQPPEYSFEEGHSAACFLYHPYAKGGENA